MSDEEYLTISEVAALLKLKPKTVKNKMVAGVFRKGFHYFSPPGLGPRFKRSAVVGWLEQGDKSLSASNDNLIPMPRSYRLNEACTKKSASPLDIRTQHELYGTYSHER